MRESVDSVLNKGDEAIRNPDKLYGLTRAQ